MAHKKLHNGYIGKWCYKLQQQNLSVTQRHVIVGHPALGAEKIDVISSILSIGFYNSSRGISIHCRISILVNEITAKVEMLNLKMQTGHPIDDKVIRCLRLRVDASFRNPMRCRFHTSQHGFFVGIFFEGSR